MRQSASDVSKSTDPKADAVPTRVPERSMPVNLRKEVELQDVAFCKGVNKRRYASSLAGQRGWHSTPLSRTCEHGMIVAVPTVQQGQDIRFAEAEPAAQKKPALYR